MEQNERNEIAKKIKALLAKTIAAGATEHETLSAMNKAHELLDKYQLSMSDLDFKEEGVSETTYSKDKVSEKLAVRVAAFCDCVVFSERSEKEVVKGKGKTARFERVSIEMLRFVGAKSDAMFAEWLLMALTSFIHGNVLNAGLFEDMSMYDMKAYEEGMIARINQRLREEVEKRKQGIATGRSLMVVKNALVDEHLAKTFRKRPHYGAFYYQHSGTEAYKKGQEKGNTISLHRPLSREMDRKRIS